MDEIKVKPCKTGRADAFVSRCVCTSQSFDQDLCLPVFSGSGFWFWRALGPGSGAALARGCKSCLGPASAALSRLHINRVQIRADSSQGRRQSTIKRVNADA